MSPTFRFLSGVRAVTGVGPAQPTAPSGSVVDLGPVSV